MHRHARPGAPLIVFVLALLACAAGLAGPVTALTAAAPNAVGLANVALPHDDEGVARAPAPATQHLTAPTLFGLAAVETAQPSTADPTAGCAHPRHHGPGARETGTRQDRAPPAITDR